MPIYEYRCSACGYQKEYLQRMSDAPLTDCPKCSKRMFNKMLTAAGFHLKVSGWYATDFKSGSKPKKAPDKPAESSKKEEPRKEEPKKAEAACGTGACPTCS